MSDGWTVSVGRFALLPEPCYIQAKVKYEDGRAKIELKVNGVPLGVYEQIIAPQPPQAELQVIDYTCSCDRCTSRTNQRYRLPFGCHTCGTEWIGEMRFGDQPTSHADCPGCGGAHTYHKPDLIKVEPELSDARWDDDSD